MLDIKWIRENKAEFDRLLAKRNIAPQSERISKLDEDQRQLMTLIQQFQNSKKKKSTQLGLMNDKISHEFEQTRRDVEHINDKLSELESKLEANSELAAILENLPNLPSEEVPVGKDHNANVLVRDWGKVKIAPNALQHFEIGEKLGLMDFTKTAKMSGSRFVSLSGDLAKLERALINFMIDTHTTEGGFLEVSPPLLVRPAAMFNTGLLPKFADESFVTTNDYRLIPTAEVPLINLVADSILKREALPIRYTAYTPCFRSEAGSAGKDTRGMIRVHQFGKVELVSISTPEEAETEHQFILNAAENILKMLELPYRVMLLCTGDMGFQSKKTYDLEVWLPGQKQYREISSCSNCGDFQSRRMKTKFKEHGSSENRFIHTLNGSGLAVGRTIVAILENYQDEEGTVSVPSVLIPYMKGQTKIKPFTK